jgi:predicted phosphodiesterase
MIRIGIIGDVHARNEQLRVALSILESRGCDLLLCVGDIVDGVGSVNECCQLLIDKNVHTVRGNHDRWLFEGRMRRLPNATQLADLSEQSKHFLSTLPPNRSFDSELGMIMLCHGLGDDDMWRPPGLAEPFSLSAAQAAALRDVSVVFHGHTHLRGLVQLPNSATLLINVGSLQDPDPSVTVFDPTTRCGQHLKLSSKNDQLLAEFTLEGKINAETTQG